MSDIIKNRYITAMEIGLENEANGITYQELIDELEKRLGNKFNKYAECTFVQWYIQNFSTVDTHNENQLNTTIYYSVQYIIAKHNNKIELLKPNDSNIIYSKVLREKAFINGDASKKYIDYLELVEARKSSKEAISKANISILIAIATMVISIIFSIWNILNQPTQPNQPYEVKVVNQSPVNNKLVDSLKNELYKADRLISLYEGDSINDFGKVIK
ncbi:hypothetical protein [Bizionia psychrotolerans]|uniref:hypothetical protein n=1 Tax=Bizionia psychrotolerans TaxID=1492901 RepID=UPI000651EB17|nr:hypothetical protein [Bizionia psychrotolerans]